VVQMKLKVPSTLTLYAPSKSGKTVLASQIIKNRAKVYNKPIHRVIYLYSIYQPIYEKLEEEEGVIFVTNVEDIDNHIEPGRHSIVVIDDQLLAIQKNPRVYEEFFVQKSHHFSLCIILMCQSIFIKGARNLALNNDYICLFNFPRDISMILKWFMQIDSLIAKDLLQVYRDIVSSGGYKYMFISFHLSESVKTRFRNSIFADKDTIVYQPRHGKNNSHHKRV